MKKLVKLFGLTTAFLVTLVFSIAVNQKSIAHAEEEINPDRITGMTPASGSIVSTSTPIVSASFNYQGSESYVNAIIYLDSENVTLAASPNAAGFSFTPTVSQGSHKVKVFLDLGTTVAIRVWSFGADWQAPSTSVAPMPNYTQDHNILVPTQGGDNFSGIVKTELWYKFNNEDWRLGPVVAGLPQTIFFDANQREKEGRYSFMTIATDNAGNTEIKSLAEEASIIFDQTPPRQIPRDMIILEQKASAPGVEDSFSCLPGSVDDDVTEVKVYRDSGLSDLIVTSVIYGDAGSRRCGSYGVGTDTPTLYFVAVDAAGNRSLPTRVDNDPQIASAPSGLSYRRVSSSAILVSWNLVPGASHYRIRYRPSGTSAFSDYIEITAPLTNATISGLEAYKRYDIAVSSKDLYGNESQYSIIKTLPLVPLTTTKVVSRATTTPAVDVEEKPTAAETPQATQPVEPSPTEETPAPTEEQTEKREETKNEVANKENGEVKGEETKGEETRNWTPWIVLAILIILAGAATGGYFYWFGGPEEITTTSSEEKKKEETKKEDKDTEARW